VTHFYQKYQRRVAVLSLVVISAWLGLGYQLFNIQIINGKDYYSQSHMQGQAKEILPAIRGNIYDVNDNPLTRNTIHYTIAADPTQISSVNNISAALSSVTGKPAKHYSKKLNSNSNFVYLERNLKKRYVQPLLDKNLEGLIIQRHSRRSYPNGNIGGQLVGFTDVDDDGLAGFELLYNDYLSGSDGWIVKQKTGLGEVSHRNNYPKQDPQDGSDLYLTINNDYQLILHEELEKQLKKSNAVAATGIILNPQTGALLAIATVPDFDPNNPGKYPVKNQRLRAVTDQFEPGSTFKIVTATAAIDNYVVDIDEHFNCENGEYKYNSITISDHESYDDLTFGEIIQHSSNIGIIKVADKVGKKRLFQYAQEYGFGSSTNLGISAESSGTLRKINDWSNVSIAEVAMGHEVGVSAIQLAMAYSAIANDGILLKPYLIRNIKDRNNQTILSENPSVVRKIADANIMNSITDLLVKAVEHGTGQEAFIPGWQVAGKTGTAQKNIDGKYSNSKFISSFVGFLPASDPQLLCVIYLDEPKHGYHWGGVGAAPVFKRTMERIINMDDSIKPPINGFFELKEKTPVLVKKEIVPTKKDRRREPILLSSSTVVKNDVTSIISTSDIPNTDTEIIVPNVKGMSLRKAIRVLQRTGLESKFAGSGRVVWQSPNPGTTAKTGEICSIGLE